MLWSTQKQVFPTWLFEELTPVYRHLCSVGHISELNHWPVQHRCNCFHQDTSNSSKQDVQYYKSAQQYLFLGCGVKRFYHYTLRKPCIQWWCLIIRHLTKEYLLRTYLYPKLSGFHYFLWELHTSQFQNTRAFWSANLILELQWNERVNWRNTQMIHSLLYWIFSIVNCHTDNQ